MILTSSESDQYSSAQKEISNFKVPLKYMTGYFCRSVYFSLHYLFMNILDLQYASIIMFNCFKI